MIVPSLNAPSHPEVSKVCSVSCRSHSKSDWSFSRFPPLVSLRCLGFPTPAKGSKDRCEKLHWTHREVKGMPQENVSHCDMKLPPPFNDFPSTLHPEGQARRWRTRTAQEGPSLSGWTEDLRPRGASRGLRAGRLAAQLPLEPRNQKSMKCMIYPTSYTLRI
jgi:hypothetical protein